ncbi:MAG: MarR family transcriptional regulator [Candidatus Marinimicrobia bacterium]|nr:MarR family transcriptional regulator [Candidatus Neomarinimicrobiota bacterium]
MSTHYKGSIREQDVLNTWIKLTRAHDSVGRVLKTNLDSSRITMTQFGVLEILEHLGPQTLKIIGEKILLTSSNLVTVVDNLERDGYVVRTQNPQDRRSIIVSLTGEGKLAIKPIFESHLQELMIAFECLSSDELQILGDLCKKLGHNQNIKEKK